MSIHPAPAVLLPGSLLQALAAEPDVDHTLSSIVGLAVETVPGCDWAGVTVRRGTTLTTPASSGTVAIEADEAQYALDEGPCVDSVWRDDTYRIDDMATETRWPAWAPVAHALGIGSSLSVRLATPRGTVGALNLYSQAVRAFGDDAVDVAHQYAAHAAAALALAHQVAGLQTALQTRHVIGAAQGVLRHRHRVTMDQAFNVLVRVSRNNNVRLRDLAQMVVDANQLPERFVGEQPEDVTPR